MAQRSNYQHSHSASSSSIRGTQDQTVGDEEYNRLLKNYKLAHERIELQRIQLLNQESGQANLRKYISLLENGGDGSGISGIGVGTIGYSSGSGGTTIDDFTIRNHSSNLNSKINNFAADVITTLIRDQIQLGGVNGQPYSPEVETLALIPLAHAILQDLGENQLIASPLLKALSDTLNGKSGREFTGGLGMLVQSLLRHLLSEILSDGIINELLITNSEEANIELTKVHEILFDREPLIAALWRKHTFSAAVTEFDPNLATSLVLSRIPTIIQQICEDPLELTPALRNVLNNGFKFSKMLHSSINSNGGSESSNGIGGFHKSFVPEIGSILDPTKIELIKRCYRTEQGQMERVGACIFPGLAKISSVLASPDSENATPAKRDVRILVVRRAQVFCECALERST